MNTNVYKLKPESEQQKKIIDLALNHNIIVDAVAGSGKTTTILQLANRYRGKNILVVTYNRRLRLETKEKIDQLKLHNIGSTNYHSLCSVLYTDAPKDNGIKKAVDEDCPPKHRFGYDIIIFDEFQDITPLYFKLAYKLYKDNLKNNTSIIVIGDRYQCIYQYKNSSHRFLAYADKLMNWNNKRWVKCDLSITYRLTKPMASFVNYLIGYERFISIKDSIFKPVYIYGDLQNIYDSINEIIKGLINKGYSYTDMFILSPTVRFKKQSNFLNQILLRLIQKGVPIYKISDEGEIFSEECSRNKLSTSTYHASKGLERKIVFVLSFDSTYYKYYGRNLDKKTLCNPLYVALTRSLERLFVVHINSNDFFQFINPEMIPKLCDVKGSISKNPSSNTSSDDYEVKYNVTDLINHLPSDLLLELTEKIKPYIQNGGKPVINIPSYFKFNLNTVDGMHISPIKQTSKTLEIHEFVAPITGIAIIMYFASLYYGESHLEHFMSRINFVLNWEKFHDQLQLFLSNNYSVSTLEEFFKLPNSYHKIIGLSLLYYVSGKYSLEKIKQINNFDWLSVEKLNECSSRIKQMIEGNGDDEGIIFEKVISRKIQTYKISGSIDCVTKSTIWEFKCTSSIDESHILQLAIYKWINNNNLKKYKLYNPLLDELIVIDTPNDVIEEIILRILEFKNKYHDNEDEEAFIAKHTLPKPNRNIIFESNSVIKSFHYQNAPLQDKTNIYNTPKRKERYVIILLPFIFILINILTAH